MPEITIRVSADPSLEARLDGMLDDAAEALGHPFNPQALKLEAVDDAGTLLGGVYGYSQLGWLFIKLLAVKPEARGSGTGWQLMQRVEAIAIERGLAGIYLDTFDFQAPGFYRKLGYEEYGRFPAIDAHPQRIWFLKRLRTGDGDAG
jgi:ribosomal protein S18 acetylase RimI-like enzyme